MTPYMSDRRSAVVQRIIWMGSLSKMKGPNTLLGVTGGTVTANKNYNARRSLVHSLKQGHSSSTILDFDNLSRMTSTGKICSLPSP